MGAAQARLTRSYVSVDDGQVHLRRMEGDGIPIVFLHQTASSGAMFEAVMGQLSGLAPMLALDTPGFGNSFDPPSPPSLERYAGWVIEALDRLGIERFHLVGHHTGGCIGLVAAVSKPQRVRSLTVIGPVYLSLQEREAYRAKSAPFVPGWDRAYLIDTWQNLAGYGSDRDLALHHRELLDNLRAWKSRSDAYNAVWSSDQPALFSQVQCRLLLMTADDDVLASSLPRVLAARPDALTAPVTGANFEPDLDPFGCASAIRAFVTGLVPDIPAPAIA